MNGSLGKLARKAFAVVSGLISRLTQPVLGQHFPDAVAYRIEHDVLIGDHAGDAAMPLLQKGFGDQPPHPLAGPSHQGRLDALHAAMAKHQRRKAIANQIDLLRRRQRVGGRNQADSGDVLVDRLAYEILLAQGSLWELLTIN